MAAIITTRTGESTQNKILEQAFIDRSNEIPPDYVRFFNIVKPDPTRSFMTWQPWAPTGSLRFKPEGQGPAYDQPFELIPITAHFFTFAIAVTATREARLEDPAGVIAQIPNMLAESEQFSKDLVFMNLFNQSFNPTITYADGQSLCSATHPLAPQSTASGVVSAIGMNFSNYLGYTPLTPETHNQARLLLETLLDDRGFPDRRDQVFLLVHPQQIKIAEEVVGSPQAPYTTANQKNTEYRQTKVVSSPFLTNPYAWWILSKQDNPVSGKGHGLVVAHKWENDFYSYYDQRTRNQEFQVSHRSAFTAVTWRGIVGAPGAPIVSG